jgi:hypothetical protein
VFSSVLFENRVIYEIMWKNIVEQKRAQVIYSTRIACWIPKATNIQSEYVILIAFTLQQWLQERSSILLYTYFACLV